MTWTRGSIAINGQLRRTVHNVANIGGVLKLQFAPGGGWFDASNWEKV